MPLDFRRLEEDVRRTQVQCIFNQLTAGLTFARMVRRLEGEQRARTLGQAHAAYNAALRFVDRVTMTDSDAQRVRRELETLKKRLEELGETF